jgi:hypothetical protein
MKNYGNIFFAEKYLEAIYYRSSSIIELPIQFISRKTKKNPSFASLSVHQSPVLIKFIPKHASNYPRNSLKTGKMNR